MASSAAVKVLGISGSLRKASYNTAALRAALELIPEGLTLEIADIAEIPLYNDDVRLQGFPPSTQKLREQIGAADALLFATPEYNYSFSGVLKNTVDWASRPPDPPIVGKPVAIMGAAQSLWGTMRAQYHLRQCCVFLNMFPLNKPQVLVGRAQEKFSSSLELTDPKTQELLRDLLAQLVERARVLKEISHHQQILVMA